MKQNPQDPAICHTRCGPLHISLVIDSDMNGGLESRFPSTSMCFMLAKRPVPGQCMAYVWQDPGL